MSFQVERLDVRDDRLVVIGHWSGLGGLRFVRPTLVIGDRHVHATLEHKPWAPTVGEPWTAAFPWKAEDAIDASRLELAVAPSVTVPLGPQDEEEEGGAEDVAPAAPTRPPQAPEPDVNVDRARIARLEADMATLVQARDALRDELDEALARAADREARCEQLERTIQVERRAALGAVADSDELNRARSAAERDRDRALEQRDEAAQDRAAAVRTRARMQRQHDEAATAREAAESELETAIGERDEARARRDEVLVAYHALQRHVRSERADADRMKRTEPMPAAPDDQTEPLPKAAEIEPPPTDVDSDAPIGVRTVPAARGMLAELQRPEPARKFVVSKFDLWAVRVLGSVAAACFILLLVSLVRVFI
ncbi:MAG: hypothetical protein M3401_00090 [Actinomycetota bacterium]|nr:hypothetical protein [Actinomycetota bacterium]